MSTTSVVQSSVPKLEGKKNYKTWELRIRPLLDSKDEWAAVDYSPRLKSAASERDKKDTTEAGLELAEQLRQRKITSPEQATTALIQEIKEAQGLPAKTQSLDEDDEDKTDSPWRYYKNNKGAVFTITSHVQDHILTKIQGIKSAKLIWEKLQKLYGTTTDLEEFLLLDKLFSTSYESAGNAHKYISQLDDTIKALDRLGTVIDPKVAKSLLLNRLGGHFTEFQARKREAGLRSFTFEDLMTQLLEEDEVNKYQEGKGVLFSKKGFKGERNQVKGKVYQGSEESEDLTHEIKKCKGCNRPGHTEDMCWKLHPELRPKRGRGGQKQASPESSDDTEELTTMPHPQYVAVTKGPREITIQLKPSHYTAAHATNTDRVWIYDTGASTHVCNDLSLFEDIGEVSYKLNGVTGADKVTKVGTVHIPVVQENGKTMTHTASNVFYVPQCPVNLLSASLMKKRANLILDMHTNKIIDRYSRKAFGMVEERGELFHLLTNYRQDTGLHESPVNDNQIRKTDLHRSSAKTISTETWYCSLGHLSYENPQRLTKVEKGIELPTLDPPNGEDPTDKTNEEDTGPPQETAPQGENQQKYQEQSLRPYQNHRVEDVVGQKGENQQGLRRSHGPDKGMPPEFYERFIPAGTKTLRHPRATAQETDAPEGFYEDVALEMTPIVANTINEPLELDMQNPVSLQEAVNLPDWTQWKEACLREIQSLKERDFFELEQPPGENLTSGKWVLRYRSREGHLCRTAACRACL